MVRRKLLPGFLAIVLLFAASVTYAQTAQEDVVVTPHAYGYVQFGQVGQGTGTALRNGSYGVEGIWTESSHAELSYEAVYKEHLKLVLGVEVNMVFSYPQLDQSIVTKYGYSEVGMGQAYGRYSVPGALLGDFEFCAGYFDYKYNPDVKNLGEYMFRSGTYPAYIRTGFDYPKARLLGAKIENKLLKGSFSHDLILNSEIGFYPSMDLTLSYLFKYNLFNLNFLEVGGGYSKAHLISVYNSKYFGALGSLTDPKNSGASGNAYRTANGDTAYFSFRGDKLMGRLSIDPKFFFPGARGFFGEQDLKIYIEAIVIGTKSYPDSTLYAPILSYNKWLEKMPVTFGFNVPAYKILDVLSLEFEWWGCKYYNDYGGIYHTSSLPLPPALVDGIDKSYWKWSLYGKRSYFDGHCNLIGQIARDHMRLPSANYDQANYREMLIQSGDWWWGGKIEFLF